MRSFIIFFLLGCLRLCAASPTFNSFNPSQVDTNGLIIKLVLPWTNTLGMVSPALPTTLVAMTNENVYGTWSTPSKVTLLSLGTNQLDMTLQSAWLLNSPTNDATQVILSLSAGAYQGQHAFLLSQNGGEGFTLPNNSEQYDVPGALVVIGSDWVGTTNRGIHLVYSAPDWVLEGVPTDPSVPGGGGGGGSVGPGTIGTLPKFGPTTSSITNSLITEDSTKLNVLEILKPNSISLNNTYTLLDADNIVLTVVNGLFDLESDDPVAANRTFTLADGTEDNFELLLVWHTNAGELINGGNMLMSTDWVPSNGDMLQLIWDAVGKWREQWRYPTVATATNVLWALTGGDTLVPDPPVSIVNLFARLAVGNTNDTLPSLAAGTTLAISSMGGEAANQSVVEIYRDAGTDRVLGDSGLRIYLHSSTNSNWGTAFSSENRIPANRDGALYFANGSIAVLGQSGSNIAQDVAGTNSAAVALSGYANGRDTLLVGSIGQAEPSLNDSISVGSIGSVITDSHNGVFVGSYAEVITDNEAGVGEPFFTSSVIQLDNRDSGVPHIIGSVEGVQLFKFEPTVVSTGSAVAYLLDTSNVLTNGDSLLTVRNAGSDRFTADALGNGFFAGTLSIGSLTNTLLRSFADLFYTNNFGEPNFYVKNATNSIHLGVTLGGSGRLDSSLGVIYFVSDKIAMTTSQLTPTGDNTVDFGTATTRWKTGWFTNVLTSGTLTLTSGTNLVTTTTALGNGAAANTGTLANAPAVGNPTKWIPINDNGVTRYIPAW